MKFHPILFSTEMVKAILEGRKTQTRRVMKLQPVKHNDVIKMPVPVDEYSKKLEELQKNGYKRIVTDGPAAGYMIPECPYGKIGDVLWVRESINVGENGNFHYKTDELGPINEVKWKPSIHMPKAACRLFLQIKNIRVERLQEILESDAVNEGIRGRVLAVQPYDYVYQIGNCPNYYYRAVEAFEKLWTKINGQESWNANPWVWVIEFERIEKPENFC